MNLCIIITNIISSATDLTSSEMRVLSAICHYANKQGTCWPSTNTLIKKANTTRSTLFRCLKGLISKGYITRESQFSNYHGSQTSNLYTVHGISQLSKSNDTPPVSYGDTPIRTTNKNNINYHSNTVKEEKEEVQTQVKTILVEEKSSNRPKKEIAVGETAHKDRPSLGNDPCRMTADFTIPVQWVLWVFANYDLSQEKIRDLSKEFVIYYSNMETFYSAGWETLYRKYIVKSIEERELKIKLENDKICSCGKHYAGKHINPMQKAYHHKWKYFRNDYISTEEMMFLIDYENVHGVIDCKIGTNIFNNDRINNYPGNIKREIEIALYSSSYRKRLIG